MANFKIRKDSKEYKRTVINFNEEDYTVIKLFSTGKEHVVHIYLAKNLIARGKAEQSKTKIERKENKGVATLVDVE